MWVESKLRASSCASERAAPFTELAIGKDDQTRECHTGYPHEPKIRVNKRKFPRPVAIHPGSIGGDTADHNDTRNCGIKHGPVLGMTNAPHDHNIVTLPL